MNRQRPEDELDALLSGGGDNPELSRALASLRDLGSVPAPAPSAELSALFGPNVVPLHRQRRRRRGVLLSAVVAASMGLGVGTVAAVSPDFRHGLQEAVADAVVLVQSGSQAEEQNDGGNSAGAPVPVATRDSGGPSAGSAASAAEAKAASDRADEAKAVAKRAAEARKAEAKKAAEAAKAAAREAAGAENEAAEANGAPSEVGEGAGQSDDSASRTGVAPGNGQLVPGQAKKSEIQEKAAGSASGVGREAGHVPQRVTVNPPGKDQAPNQLKEKAKEAPGQLKEKAEAAPGQLKEKDTDNPEN
jgi:hypothetical protein